MVVNCLAICWDLCVSLPACNSPGELLLILDENSNILGGSATCRLMYHALGWDGQAPIHMPSRPLDCPHGFDHISGVVFQESSAELHQFL